MTWPWMMVLLCLPVAHSADIGFCDTAMTTNVIVRIMKAAHDNQHTRCECYISPSGTMTVQASYKLVITKSICGEEFYFFFNGTRQFRRCSDSESNTAANNSPVFGYESRGMWLFYMWKKEMQRNNTGHIEIILKAIRGNVTVHCNQNDNRTKATTQMILKPTRSFTPTTTRSQLTSTESMTRGQTLEATTDDPDVTTSLITSKSTVTELKGGADDETVGNTNNTFIVIAAVVAVAVLIIIIAIISVFCYRRKKSSNVMDKTRGTDSMYEEVDTHGVSPSSQNHVNSSPHASQYEELNRNESAHAPANDDQYGELNRAQRDNANIPAHVSQYEKLNRAQRDHANIPAHVSPYEELNRTETVENHDYASFQGLPYVNMP